MKRFILVILATAALTLSQAAPKKTKDSHITVAVYNLTSSKTRAKDVEKGKAPQQRLWTSCVDAVAAQLVEADCDVVGLLDVCDSIAGKAGNSGLPDALDARNSGYSWLALSNTRPSLPYEGAYNKTQAIIWKKDKYDCIDHGINWLGGYFDKNRIAGELKGDATKSVTWARFREKSTGKEFYFMVASVNGISNEELCRANCENLLKIAKEIIVTDGAPSVIAGSFNMQDDTPVYKDCLAYSQWHDVYARLKEDSLLPSSEVSNKNTRNNVKGEKPSSGRPDYLFVNAFDIDAYTVIRDRYPSADGTPVYPAYGFPVVASLRF